MCVSGKHKPARYHQFNLSKVKGQSHYTDVLLLNLGLYTERTKITRLPCKMASKSGERLADSF